MYKIIGSNGTEYGPVTLEQLRAWVVEGRVNADTQTQLEGEAGWRPLSTFPELAALLPSRAAAPPLPPSPTPFGVGAQNPAAQSFAQDEINAPSIGLMVTAGLSVILVLMSLVMNLSGATMSSWNQMQSSPGMDPQMLEMIKKFQGFSQTFGVFEGILHLLLAGFIFFGAMKMRKLENFGLCVAACIVALVPCISPCCCLGLPIGIWALIVMNRPEVRIHFK
jgi:hypothetical protein